MSNLNPLQSKLLQMLIFFHDFCMDNDLTYYALGGTVIGALRHGGFIPWDDDIDIGMPRKDYIKLCQLLNGKKMEEKYVLETVYSSEEHIFPYAKLYDTTTTLIENTKYMIKRGIYLDVFPLDGIGSSQEEGLSNYRAINWRLTLLELKRIKINSERNLLKNILLFGVQSIPEMIISAHRLSKKIDQLCQKYTISETMWGGNLVGAWHGKEIMPTYIFGKPCMQRFEGVNILCPEKSEEYLERQYGDWKKLPSEDKRVSHHDYYVDLSRGYME